MTAATVADGGTGRAWVAGAARLMRIELCRNAMIWMLPVAGVLFWALTYRRSMALAPLWNVRAMTMQSTTIAVFIPTVTGVAAWTGTRTDASADRHRHRLDHLTPTYGLPHRPAEGASSAVV